MIHARRNQSTGFSLVEVLVASLIFLFVAVVAYTAYQQSTETYLSGTSRAETQQRTRLAFEVMLDEMRLAGFDYNRDGVENAYPDATDEQIEFTAAAAITFRANLDYEDDQSGREPSLEIGPGHPDFGVICCPIVTVGNDEIITYALRSDDASKNGDAIVFRVDTSAPRDAGWDMVTGEIVGEELVQIENVDLSGMNPPYTLIRFHLAEDGSVVERPLAADVRALELSYEGSDGNDYYCTNPADDGSCAVGDQVPFASIGGADHLSGTDGRGRIARQSIRRIQARVVGMAEKDDRRYFDETDPLAPHRPKFALETTIVPRNLGLRGRPDLDSTTVQVPTGVSVCTGQCDTLRVEWNEASGAIAYNVNVYREGETVPFFSGSTPGVNVQDSSPRRVYARFQGSDHPGIADGQRLYATVQARSDGEVLSESSAPSSTILMRDVTRIEAPRGLVATGYDPEVAGWPNVAELGLLPTMGTGGAFDARANSIRLFWEAPEFVLNVLDQGDPAGSWTTDTASGSAALACDSEQVDLDGDGTFDTERTTLLELASEARYLVFRSTDPRFIPSDDDVVAQVIGAVDPTTGLSSWEDRSAHVYQSEIFQRSDSVLANCQTYHYRIRAVDACWDGTGAATRSHPNLSPFWPALNPDATSQDSDDIDAVPPGSVGLATPGYAVPRAAPKPPSNVRFTRFDRDTLDGDGLDAVIGFDASKKDAYTELSGAELVWLPEDIVVQEYRVYSHASDPGFTAADAVSGLNGVRLEKVVPVWNLHALRIAHDDENGDGIVSLAEDETVPPLMAVASPNTALRIDLADMSSRYYKVLAAQCTDDYTVPDHDSSAWDFSGLSEAVLFPCDVGGGPNTVIYVDASNFDQSVTATFYPEDVSVWATQARLILKDPATGERAMSSWPGLPVDGSGNVTFDADHIAQLTNNFGSGNYLIFVEMDDSNGCTGISDDTKQTSNLPACCLTPSAPVAVVVGTLRARSGITEVCNTLSPQILEIRINAAKRGGPTKRVQTVTFDGTVIWSNGDTQSNTNFVIDRRGDPIVLGVGTSAQLELLFDRDPKTIDLYITYVYKIAGAQGLCEFVQTNLQ